MRACKYTKGNVGQYRVNKDRMLGMGYSGWASMHSYTTMLVVHLSAFPIKMLVGFQVGYLEA